MRVCVFSTMPRAAEWLHICPANTADMPACITESVTSLRTVLGEGYPPLDLPSLNPFVLDNLIVSRTGGLTMELTHVEIYNAHISHMSNLK